MFSWGLDNGACQCNIAYMCPALNIREFPDDLLKRAKIAAIQGGVTLRQYVIRAVEAAVKTPKGKKAAKGA